jgi:hypothetical protein
MERPRGKCAMLWLLDRATQLTNLKREAPCPEPLTCETALKTTALAATLLFAHGRPQNGRLELPSALSGFSHKSTDPAALRRFIASVVAAAASRLLSFPIAAGMLAHAARSALISVAGANAATGALVACMLVSGLMTPIVDRLHLPFAALAFSAVVSLMPGFFLFNAATGLVELVSIGPSAPATLPTSIATNGVTAFLIIMAMTFGLILPRMLFERVLSASASA